MKKALWLVFFYVATYCLAGISSELSSGEEKERELFRRINESAYGKDSLPSLEGPSWWQSTNFLDAGYMSRAFTHDGDTMAAGRQKYQNKFGTTALVAFVPKGVNPFTGLFSAGAPHGLLRVSIESPPSKDRLPIRIPGMAIKFFVDAKASVNVLAMPSLEGHTNKNLFAHAFETSLRRVDSTYYRWVREPTDKRALRYAGQYKANPRVLTLEHMASVTSMGEPVVYPVSPYSLVFEPSLELKAILGSGEQDFRSALEGKGEGLVLFEVFARSSSDSEPILIGQIQARSNFVASAFGDEELFFKHPRSYEPPFDPSNEF